jgi:hypothetical protein
LFSTIFPIADRLTIEDERLMVEANDVQWQRTYLA